MSKTLSVYFSNDRTYLSILEKADMKMSLDYFETTENPIDLEDPDTERSKKGAEELASLLGELKDEDLRVTLTIPSDLAFVSKFPGSNDLSSDEIKGLVNMEIRQAFPQFDTERFAANVIPLEPNIKGNKMMQAIILSKDNFRIAKRMMKPLGKMISNIEISQLNAHNAFNYNYPEEIDSTVVLFGIQDNFIDISVIKATKPVYYHIRSFSDTGRIGEICLKETELITEKYSSFINSAYFFGTGLTKDILDSSKEAIGDKISRVSKLSAFRMMPSDLSKREIEYCKRTAHLYPPCIGGAIAPYHQRIKIA